MNIRIHIYCIVIDSYFNFTEPLGNINNIKFKQENLNYIICGRKATINLNFQYWSSRASKKECTRMEKSENAKKEATYHPFIAKY